MGDVNPQTVLADPLAKELMNARIPARFAHAGTDGAPRVVPVAFHWTGSTFLVGTEPTTPKVASLRARPAVALTVDTNEAPQHVLLVRGTAKVDIVDGVFPEYLDGARRLVPAEAWDEPEQTVRGTYAEMARIEITPTWAKLIDFETACRTSSRSSCAASRAAAGRPRDRGVPRAGR